MTEAAKHIPNVGGRLGFHAPYLVEPAKPDDRKYSRRDIVNVFKLAISSVTDAIELFDRRTYGGPGLNDDNRPWVNASLFIEMLRKGPDELFAIDTVGKSGRWGIKLVGVKEIGVLNTQALQRACDNVYSWEGDREGIWEDERLAFEPVPPSDPVFNRLKNMKGVSLFQFQVIRSFNYCAVQAAPSPTPKVESLIIKLYRGLPPPTTRRMSMKFRCGQQLSILAHHYVIFSGSSVLCAHNRVIRPHRSGPT